MTRRGNVAVVWPCRRNNRLRRNPARANSRGRPTFIYEGRGEKEAGSRRFNRRFSRSNDAYDFRAQPWPVIARDIVRALTNDRSPNFDCRRRRKNATTRATISARLLFARNKSVTRSTSAEGTLKIDPAKRSFRETRDVELP